MRKLKIKKGAVVEVITGSDKGKKGNVLSVDAVNMRILVQGVRVQTHYDRKEGIQKKEGYLDYSNVKLVQQAEPKKGGKKKATKQASKSA